MSFATVAGSPILGGSIKFRAAGNWTAELKVTTANPADVTGAVSLTVGETEMSGTATVVGADEGRLVSLRVAGGAGGLGAPVGPQGYNNPTRRVVLQDALAVGGETLSPTASSTVLDTQLPAWDRLGGSVADSVWRVVEHAGATWRVLLDGSVWVGTDTWDEVDESVLVVEGEDPANKVASVALEDVLVLPGHTLLGQHVRQVVYTLDSARMRAEVSFGEGRGEWEELLGSVVREEVAHLDYLGSYLCKAVGQNGDGTLELRPYDSRIPPMSRVPVRFGLPGMVAWQIVPGSDVVVRWDGGDPAKRYVDAFSSAQALKLSVGCPDIRLGSDAASDFAAATTKVMAELAKMITTFNAHTHPVSGPSTSAPVVPMTAASNVGCTKVKVE